MNKAYKYTLTANERKEITFDVGVNRLAISNANGTDGDITIVTSEITKTDSGDICSFVDGADAPFADFKVNIEAVQNGSGDPSPDNVRPITAWNGANIYVSGEDTSNPITYNINWQSMAGTLGKGVFNPLTGVLTVTHKIYEMSSVVSWEKENPNGFACYITIADMTNKNNVICDSFKYSDETVTSMPLNSFGGISGASVTLSFVLDATDITEANAIIQELKPKILYELATPATYQLTPTEIRSLLGVNNVWADCGPVNVRYFVQSTQPMIDYVDDKTPAFFDAVEDLRTYDVSLVGAKSTDIKNYLLSHKNANIVIRVKRYSTIMLYYLREYSPNYFAEFATHAIIFDAEGTKSMRIDYLRLDLTQETSDFTDDYIILPTA